MTTTTAKDVAFTNITGGALTINNIATVGGYNKLALISVINPTGSLVSVTPVTNFNTGSTDHLVNIWMNHGERIRITFKSLSSTGDLHNDINLGCLIHYTSEDTTVASHFIPVISNESVLSDLPTSIVIAMGFSNTSGTRDDVYTFQFKIRSKQLYKCGYNFYEDTYSNLNNITLEVREHLNAHRWCVVYNDSVICYWGVSLPKRSDDPMFMAWANQNEDADYFNFKNSGLFPYDSTGYGNGANVLGIMKFEAEVGSIQAAAWASYSAPTHIANAPIEDVAGWSGERAGWKSSNPDLNWMYFMNLPTNFGSVLKDGTPVSSVARKYIGDPPTLPLITMRPEIGRGVVDISTQFSRNQLIKPDPHVLYEWVMHHKEGGKTARFITQWPGFQQNLTRLGMEMNSFDPGAKEMPSIESYKEGYIRYRVIFLNKVCADILNPLKGVEWNATGWSQKQDLPRLDYNVQKTFPVQPGTRGWAIGKLTTHNCVLFEDCGWDTKYILNISTGKGNSGDNLMQLPMVSTYRKDLIGVTSTQEGSLKTGTYHFTLNSQNADYISGQYADISRGLIHVFDQRRRVGIISPAEKIRDSAPNWGGVGVFNGSYALKWQCCGMLDEGTNKWNFKTLHGKCDLTDWKLENQKLNGAGYENECVMKDPADMYGISIHNHTPSGGYETWGDSNEFTGGGGRRTYINTFNCTAMIQRHNIDALGNVKHGWVKNGIPAWVPERSSHPIRTLSDRWWPMYEFPLATQITNANNSATFDGLWKTHVLNNKKYHGVSSGHYGIIDQNQMSNRIKWRRLLWPAEIRGTNDLWTKKRYGRNTDFNHHEFENLHPTKSVVVHLEVQCNVCTDDTAFLALNIQDAITDEWIHQPNTFADKSYPGRSPTYSHPLTGYYAYKGTDRQYNSTIWRLFSDSNDTQWNSITVVKFAQLVIPPKKKFRIGAWAAIGHGSNQMEGIVISWTKLCVDKYI